MVCFRFLVPVSWGKIYRSDGPLTFCFWAVFTARILTNWVEPAYQETNSRQVMVPNVQTATQVLPSQGSEFVSACEMAVRRGALAQLRATRGWAVAGKLS